MGASEVTRGWMVILAASSVAWGLLYPYGWLWLDAAPAEPPLWGAILRLSIARWVLYPTLWDALACTAMLRSFAALERFHGASGYVARLVALSAASFVLETTLLLAAGARPALGPVPLLAALLVPYALDTSSAGCYVVLGVPVPDKTPVLFLALHLAVSQGARSLASVAVGVTVSAAFRGFFK